MRFDFNDLRLFAAVAETDSLTRGAERVHTSVSAASIRVRNLEERIGTKLLYRNSQGVTLSPAGQALARHARLVMGQLEHLNNDLQEYGRGVKGHLRVFATTTAVTEFLPPVLGRYLAAHPDVNIDFRERPSAAIVRAVGEGHADIGIVAGTVRTEGLETRPYRREQLVLVVPAGHELAQRDAASFGDSLRYDQIGLHEGSAIHTFLAQIARTMNSRIPLRIQVGNFEAACRMVEARVGIGVMPESAARRYAGHMNVRVLRLEDAWSLRNQQICVQSVERLPVFARDLLELLEQDAARDAADGPGAEAAL